MKKWRPSLLLLVLLSCAGEDDTQPITEFSGVIIDNHTGKPFENIEKMSLQVRGNCFGFSGCPSFYNFDVNTDGTFSFTMPWGKEEVENDLRGYTIYNLYMWVEKGTLVAVKLTSCDDFVDCKSFWLGGKFTDLKIRVQQL